jgi:threonine/homoserine/homoserine lactone efflux protein
MTISSNELGLYIFGLFVLFMTPGPVWVALVARVLAGGFQQVWPLALGVAIGDIFWSVLAALGMGWVAASFGDAMLVLKYLAIAFFIGLGGLIIKNADQPISNNKKLTRPGVLAGFLAGLVVILANPKAILFYMGVLPGFFDLSRLTTPDIIAIAAASFVVPLVGNLTMALFIDRMRQTLSSPEGLRRMNLIAGSLLMGVGVLLFWM